jgi:hypothetical protein
MLPDNFGQNIKVEILIFFLLAILGSHGREYVGKNNIRSSCEHLEGVFLTL